MGQQTSMFEHLPFATDQVIGSRARIGLVVLSTDYTIEHEMRALIICQVLMCFTRELPIRRMFRRTHCGRWGR